MTADAHERAFHERAGHEPVVLAIAGSDSSGGAGLQADLRTATALGCYAATVVTAVTAQSTRGVDAVHPVPAEVLLAQLRAVAGELEVHAVKTGMLGDAATVAAVAGFLAEELGDVPVVVDPVMVATSGDRLLAADAVDAVRELLVPRATVVTPNAPEAEVLTGTADRTAAAYRLRDLGAAWALVKGGHVPVDDTVTDLLLGPDDATLRLVAPWLDTPNTHGTGCTLSSAIATRLALGDPVPEAVTAAHAYLQGALRSGAARRIGGGHGPVDHLWPLRSASTHERDR